MLPPERVMGKPEALMSDKTGIGVGVELLLDHILVLDDSLSIRRLSGHLRFVDLAICR
jgi:hypothetical protein